MHKILIIGRGYHVAGGVSRYVYNLMMNINLNKFSVDFIAHVPENNNPNTVNDLISYGINCYYAPFDLVGVKQFLVNHLKKHSNYEVVHIHVTSGSFYSLAKIIRKLSNAKIIFHSHTYIPGNSFKKYIHRYFYRKEGDFFLACSEKAGQYMFGDEIIKTNRFKVVKNGVDMEQFSSDNLKREVIREKYNIGNAKVFGFVGRLSSEKRVHALIDIYKKILNYIEDSYLMIVGEGEQKDSLIEKCREEGIEEKVIFTGAQSDTSSYMNAFDLFILPSRYESLGIVLIEAQACGTNCLVSSGVSNESNISSLWHAMPENAQISDWAQMAIDIVNNTLVDCRSQVLNSGFNIKDTVAQIEEIFQTECENM